MIAQAFSSGLKFSGYEQQECNLGAFLITIYGGRIEG
jgi:hypothetical protein